MSGIGKGERGIGGMVLDSLILFIDTDKSTKYWYVNTCLSDSSILQLVENLEGRGIWLIFSRKPQHMQIYIGC